MPFQQTILTPMKYFLHLYCLSLIHHISRNINILAIRLLGVILLLETAVASGLIGITI